jgi:FkbM family methyltransferase
MNKSEKRQLLRTQNELMVTKFAPNAKTLYDIGVGPKSEWKSIPKKIPGIKLCGCEPHPELHKELLKEFPGGLLPIAIGNERGTLTLYVHKDEKQSSMFDVGSSEPFKVEMWTLDEFDEFFMFPEDIILWMDIEGSELRALQGADRLLSSGRVTAINLEVRDNPKAEGWPTADEIEIHLNKYQYVIQRKYNNQTTHYDVIYTKKSMT